MSAGLILFAPGSYVSSTLYRFAGQCARKWEILAACVVQSPVRDQVAEREAVQPTEEKSAEIPYRSHIRYHAVVENEPISGLRHSSRWRPNWSPSKQPIVFVWAKLAQEENGHGTLDT